MNKIDDILGRIVMASRVRLDERRSGRDLSVLEALIEDRPPPKSPQFSQTGGVDIWAEIKPVSPVHGTLREKLDVSDQAKAYQDGGASVISVLTEQDFFHGNLENIRLARLGAPDLPLMRKDFLLEQEEILEARAYGADGVLLIVRLLDDPALLRLLGTCDRLGLFALTEAYTETEVERAVDAGAKIVGVNSRDLETFSVDRKKLKVCRSRIPNEVFAVAESGVSSIEQLAEAKSLGFQAVLVGEALMRAEDPRSLLQQWSRI